MTKELFDEIFKNEIYPFINEINENNSLIKTKNIYQCITDIYSAYTAFNKQYKEHIFSSKEDCLLDRHRVASCICGAFLKTSIFNKTDMIQWLKTEKQPIEAIFYYVNELVSLYAGCKYLSFFMMYDKRNDAFTVQSILNQFPVTPDVSKVKKVFWSCVLFNLSQIKDTNQIGLEHYDLYSYAMFFFHLEKIFYEEKVQKN